MWSTRNSEVSAYVSSSTRSAGLEICGGSESARFSMSSDCHPEIQRPAGAKISTANTTATTILPILLTMHLPTAPSVPRPASAGRTDKPQRLEPEVQKRAERAAEIGRASCREREKNKVADRA